ncbi:hypothetical protein CWE12_01140 [Aliidiomarina sedimenti]|uniref:Cellulose biosynthesis protein BcsF n=1 Tax=Aliidiomarina sedimenti TaxID=1933879 RepID=A0ABY0C1D6_9GAMM|nr:hypothetical protein [Aliidiomarina sedimenti]RUO31634.1 hypothetical protein CWE12_01140 [Aliidiomarina sedimenti]
MLPIDLVMVLVVLAFGCGILFFVLLKAISARVWRRNWALLTMNRHFRVKKRYSNKEGRSE